MNDRLRLARILRDEMRKAKGKPALNRYGGLPRITINDRPRKPRKQRATVEKPARPPKMKQLELL